MHKEEMRKMADALRVTDPADADMVASTHERAKAMLQIAMMFFLNRLGRETAKNAIVDFLREVDAALAAQRSADVPGSSQTTATRPVTAEAERSLVECRAKVMLGYLEGVPAPQADAEARASILASAAFLRLRLGEKDMIEYLRSVQARMSLEVWLEQLPTASLAKH